jgi:hypothetical protein
MGIRMSAAPAGADTAIASTALAASKNFVI